MKEEKEGGMEQRGKTCEVGEHHRDGAYREGRVGGGAARRGQGRTG